MKDRGEAYELAGRYHGRFQEEWRATVELLQVVHSDYHRARKQLEEVCLAFGERETMAGQRLRSVLETVNQRSGEREHPPLEDVAPSAAISLQVYCLGSFEVRLGWEKIDRWRSLKAKSVFQYLVAHRGRPVPRDVLMEGLWPDWDPQLANNNLKAAIYALRQTLNPFSNGKDGFPYILFLDGNYLINPKVELWIDVEEFEQRWTVGRRLEREGRQAEATRECELAETLYRGDYLEDDPYAEWTLLRREALKDVYLALLGKLADHSIETADYETSIVYCQKILAKDPCREDAYRRLMRSLSRLGQRNRALRWYEICVSTIRAALDTPPDSETVALYHKLLKNEYI